MAALVLLAADGKRNLPSPPALTIVGDEPSGYRIEEDNELRQQEKNLFTGIGEYSQVAYSPVGNLMPSYASIFRWFKNTFSRLFVRL